MINALTGNRERMPLPELTAEQWDALMVLLEGKPYSEHLVWNGREYFNDDGLWVVAWRDLKHDSGDKLDRPEEGREAALSALLAGADRSWKPKFNREGERVAP